VFHYFYSLHISRLKISVQQCHCHRQYTISVRSYCLCVRKIFFNPLITEIYAIINTQPPVLFQLGPFPGPGASRPVLSSVRPVPFLGVPSELIHGGVSHLKTEFGLLQNLGH